MRRLISVFITALGLTVLVAPAAQAAPEVGVSRERGTSVGFARAGATFNPDREVVGVAPSTAQVFLAAAASGDGCTASPDSWGKANFRPACDKHDVCYSAGSTTDRKVCDARFRTDLLTICNATYSASSPFRYTCRGIAETYYAAVRTFGGAFYKGPGATTRVERHPA